MVFSANLDFAVLCLFMPMGWFFCMLLLYVSGLLGCLGVFICFCFVLWVCLICGFVWDLCVALWLL